MDSKISPEIIEQFLEGKDSQKYIVAIEANYDDEFVYLIINDPEKGKFIEKHKYVPFVWLKQEIFTKLYDGNRHLIREAMKKYGVKLSELKTTLDENPAPKKLINGYRIIAKGNGSYGKLIQFFKAGGIDPFNKEHKNYFTKFSPEEQFMIQTGKRLFKGFEDFNDLDKLQFDLETEGLNPKKDGIFQIGIRNNRGFEKVLEVVGNTIEEKLDSERKNIIEFFKIIRDLVPDVISGYNSENFDWPFFEVRCRVLGLDFKTVVKTLKDGKNVYRKKSSLKLGGESEDYLQTNIWGFNVMDISHSVRRAQAINSDIKQWSLKYITKFSKIAKPNRVYIDGSKIHQIWASGDKYIFNEINGEYFKLTDKNFIPSDTLKIVSGDYIVRRYLLDDLWETEMVDGIYNQASFLIAKLLPTNFMRSSTMGTAGQWKLIMAAWSYENDLAIPELEVKRKFTGGLSRLLVTGYSRTTVKFDYAALYPKTQLTWDIVPDSDISGVMFGLLTYIVDNRDKYKFLAGEYKEEAKKLKEYLSSNEVTESECTEIELKITELKKLEFQADKKQLPLKILANSFFGAYGAPYTFNWGDSNCAEETTCRGRQYLRLMVKHFYEKYNFKPLVGDSVTYDTPVYVRYKTEKSYIDILPICDLFNNDSTMLDKEGLRDFEEKPFEVLTRNGWREMKYVYRHGTDKKIHRITTKDRLINVTEDHSLFQGGKEVKPSELKRFDKIDVYEIPKNNTETGLTINKAYLLGFFLGDGSSNCSNRKQKYTSPKTGLININNGKRSDWKISNSRIGLLEKLQNILKDEYSIDGVIKNHIKSSGVYNLVVHNSKFTKEFCDNFYTSYREKKIPYEILNANKDIKKAFIEGVFASDGYGDNIENCSDIGMKSQIAMAGISMILKELGIDFKIKTRKDKENFISFNLKNRNRNNSNFTNKTKKRTDEVWKNEIIFNRDKNNYVYDISTEDGTFICGINGVIAHNTDGFNFEIPKNVDDFTYICKANHWKTKKYDVGEILYGLDAVLAEFNETYMIGRMGLDIDDIYDSTINFKRKNYANKLNGKIKLVGNSIKSKAMSVYIEDFLNKGIVLLLDGKGYEFIEWYYEYINKIYNYEIPVLKIASKSKVKMTLKNYKDVYCKEKTIAGNYKSRQAHMELALKEGLNVTLGDIIYYVNTGTMKSHADIKVVKDKETKNFKSVEFNCKLIPSEMLESNPNLTTDEYNVTKYIHALNTRIKPLLVCFHPDIRDQILISIIRDRKTKLNKLEERNYFTESQCELVSGYPLSEEDQDDYIKDLMVMEDKEIRFWDSVDKVPNNMDINEWYTIRDDWQARIIIERENGIINEKKKIIDILSKLSVAKFNTMRISNKLPKELAIFTDIMDIDGEQFFISDKWETELHPLNIILEFNKLAIEREEFYGTLTEKKYSEDDKYKLWLEFSTNSGKSYQENNHVVNTENSTVIDPIEKDDEWPF